ncbi:MAG TPA: hypothetical protein VLJ68_03865 [Chitinophagaceae bacterium]|nr:hypothetical protein [Chitinophagaceae bacterium]
MKQPNLWTYLAAAGIVTVLIGLIYGSVQQGHRAVANDPQIQVARDLATRVKTDTTPVQLTGEKIQLEQSLGVFTALFDVNGEPVQSTGMLGNEMPHLPKGVFETAKRKDEFFVTWQPRGGVRMALVICSVQSGGIGYAVAGRSLKEVEKRVGQLTLFALFAWLSCIAILVLHWIIMVVRYRKASL